MRHFKILSAITVASIAFISCRNAANKELTVPKEASTVVRLNGSSITSKASWNDLLQADWFRREKQRDTDSFDKQLMQDPARSGVDLKSDFIYFTHKKDLITYSVFEGQLKNVPDFENLLAEKIPGRKIEDGGDFHFMPVDNSDLVSWTDSRFVYISGEQMMGENHSVSLDSLKAYAASLYHLKSGNSMESEEKYSMLLKESGDIHFWSNTADALSNFPFGPVPLIAASALMQGSITAGTIDFENGKIAIRSKQYLNPTLSHLLDKYAARPLTADLLDHVSEGASVVVAMKYDPQLIKDFLRVSGLERKSNEMLEEYHLSFDELLRSTRGEILMTASELGPQSNTEDDEESDDIFPFGGNLLFATSLNNDSSFTKVDTIFRHHFPAAVTGTRNNWFLAGNSAAVVQHFFTPNGHSIVSEKLSGHPFGLYIDIEKGLQQWNVHGFDSALLQQINLSKNFWRTVISTGGEFKDGSIRFETNINLADPSTNSLKQLAKYSAEMSQLIKKDEYAEIGSLKNIPFVAYTF